MMEQLIAAKDFLKGREIESPEIGIVLGTGLHQLLNYVDVKTNYFLYRYSWLSCFNGGIS